MVAYTEVVIVKMKQEFKSKIIVKMELTESNELMIKGKPF